MSKRDTEYPWPMELVVSDSWGIYCPQRFVEGFGEHLKSEDMQALAESIAIVGTGPDHEWHYWEAWQEILDTAQVEDTNGLLWSIMQDGDVWLIHPEAEWSDEDETYRFPEDADDER